MRSNRGAALITVMLVIAIVSVIAVNLGSSLQRQVSRSANLYQAEQSYWMWLSAEAVLAEVLQLELEQSDGIVHAEQNWATRQGPFPVAGGQIAA
ncbi:MAG TPA: type II secretory pathway protein, partial [Idiomarina sp.]|nr:type II secretory pathway protein [Idiomarina sp.]